MNSIKKILNLIDKQKFVIKLKKLIGIKKKKDSQRSVNPFIVDVSDHDWEQHNDNVSF